MKRYKCKSCGYVLKGELTPSTVCPVCNARSNMFKDLDEEKVDIKGTKTEENLKQIFNKVSRLRNKTSFYADAAKKENLLEIFDFLNDISSAEKEHTKICFNTLNNITTTEENLRELIEDKRKITDMYMEMAKDAEKEKLYAISEKMLNIAFIERIQMEQCQRYLEKLKRGNSDNSDIFIWKCDNCGCVVAANEAPLTCPVCGCGREHFKEKGKTTIF